jgi:hypothetical protein
VKYPTRLVCSRVDDIRLALVLTDYSAPKAKEKMTLPITLSLVLYQRGNPGGSELFKETNNECTSTCKRRSLVGGFAEQSLITLLSLLLLLLLYYNGYHQPTTLLTSSCR